MCFSPLYIIMYQYMYSIYIILHLQLLSPWMYNQTITFKISTQVQNKNLFAFDIVFNMYSIKSHRIFCRPELKAFMEHCTTWRSYSFCIKKMCWSPVAPSAWDHACHQMSLRNCIAFQTLYPVFKIFSIDFYKNQKIKLFESVNCEVINEIWHKWDIILEYNFFFNCFRWRWAL